MVISASLKWVVVGSIFLVPVPAESPVQEDDFMVCSSHFVADPKTACQVIQVICTDREHRIVYKSEAC